VDRIQDWWNTLDALRLSGKTMRWQALRLHLWATANIKQRKESKDWWQDPENTLLRGYGDCDDFASLWYAGLRYLGVPPDAVGVYWLTKPHVICGVELPGESAFALDNLERGLKPLDEYTWWLRLDEGMLRTPDPGVITSDFVPRWESWLLRASEMDGLGFLTPEIGGH